MPMSVMYFRLGEREFEQQARKYYQSTIERYWYQFLNQKERVVEDYDGCFRIRIKSKTKWEHRFFGVTEQGVPIWDSSVSLPVAPKSQEEVYQNDKTCKSEEVTSFKKWKSGRKRLAFIYLGVFWTLEKGENLNDAAKRFILAHQEVKNCFERRRKNGDHVGFDEENVYIYEIFRDGGLIFKDGKAVLESEDKFVREVSGQWAIMAAEGYFEREGVKEVGIDCHDFWSWYSNDKVL